MKRKHNIPYLTVIVAVGDVDHLHVGEAPPLLQGVHLIVVVHRAHG